VRHYYQAFFCNLVLGWNAVEQAPILSSAFRISACAAAGKCRDAIIANIEIRAMRVNNFRKFP
jgi:hypothetical protein